MASLSVSALSRIVSLGLSTVSTVSVLAIALIGCANLSGCAKETAPKEGGEVAPSAAKAVAEPTPTAVTKEVAAKDELASNTSNTDESMSCAGAEYEDKEEKAGGCNQWDAEAAAVLKKEVPSDALWATYTVSGMKCGGCERRVIAKIGTVDGVVGVEADAELGQVRVATSAQAPKAVELARTELNKLYKIQAN